MFASTIPLVARPDRSAGGDGHPLAAIGAVVICPGGVLYDDTLWWRWLVQLLGRMGLHTHPDLFYELWRRDHYAGVCRGEQSYEDALRTFLLSAGLSRGQCDEVWAAGRSRWRAFHEQLRPFPKIPASLAMLHAAGFSIAAFAHVPETAAELAQSYDGMGIGQFVEFVATTRDLGVGPFDRSGVEAALDRFGLAPGQTALVGRRPWGPTRALPVEPFRVAVGCPESADAHLHVNGFDEFAAALVQAGSHALAG